MPSFFLVITLLIISSLSVRADTGKVYLRNGHVFEGEITRTGQGGVWVHERSGSIMFEKSEIKRVVITAKKDVVRDGFMSSFRITPAATAPQAVVVTPYEDIINREAHRQNIDPALVKAVIKAESNFNPVDRSCKGACGLMQLMPQTAKILGVKQIYHPEQNIRGGTRYLRDMLSLFRGDVNLAVAAYNAGPGAVKKYGGSVPPYNETRNYVSTVSRFYKKFRKPGRIVSFTDSAGREKIYNVK